jgi:hypothetical protein
MSSTEPARAHVREVHVSAGAACKKNVANHHYFFGFGRYAFQAEAGAHNPFVHRAAVRESRLLAVVDDRDAERSRVLERCSH